MTTQIHFCRWFAVLMVVAMSPVSHAGVKSRGKTPNDYGLPQVQAINQQIAQSWSESEFSPSSVASDGEFCRRMHLDLIGRIPSTEELDRYLADRNPESKSGLPSV